MTRNITRPCAVTGWRLAGWYLAWPEDLRFICCFVWIVKFGLWTKYKSTNEQRWRRGCWWGYVDRAGGDGKKQQEYWSTTKWLCSFVPFTECNKVTQPRKWMNGASQMRIDIIKGNKISVAKLEVHTRAVRKVSSHFEYLENRSRGL